MRKANKQDIKVISEMLYAMYNELQPILASKDIHKYVKLAEEHLKKDFVFLEINNKSLFIMRDISSPVINKKLWDGVSVYIKPEYRKTRILKKMYDYMFSHFNGTIIGYVEENSEHKKVLVKRHKLLGSLYELRRK